jgi:predicted nucleic acid-binding protein
MSVFVVDASVGLKWFVPETHDADARRLQNPAHELHVPTLFDVEIGNILWKKVRNGELTRAEADTILAQLPVLPLKRHESLPLLPEAFDIADRNQRSVYDCLYLALAVDLRGRMVTADQKFFNALATAPWAAYLCWVADIP